MKATTRMPLPTLYAKDLIDTAAAFGSFTTFGKAVEYAGLSQTLRGAGPFTIFAPTDAAFQQLPIDQQEAMFKPENREDLACLLNNHILKGHQLVGDIGKWDSARMVLGTMASIKRTDEGLSIDGATVTSADIGTSNGVLHGIDKVNFPTKD